MEIELYYNSEDGILSVYKTESFGDSTLVARYQDRRGRGITLDEMLENIKGKDEEVLMTKEFLDNIENTSKELENLKKRLAKIENKEITTVKDSVQSSSVSYPYIQHNCVIEGVEIPKNRHLKAKYRKMIRNKTYKLEKLKIKLEYELNYIEDSEIRDIIRYRYNDNKTWLQIMFLKNYNNEDTARKKLERFLKKN